MNNYNAFNEFQQTKQKSFHGNLLTYLVCYNITTNENVPKLE